MELKMPKAYWIKPQGNGIIREEHLGGGYMDAGEVRAYISAGGGNIPVSPPVATIDCLRSGGAMA